jgi:type II secretory pathway component PulK
MKTKADHPFAAARRRGSAVLVILVLLACMMALIAANSTTLYTLKQELKLIDKHQQKKFGARAGG